MNYLFHALRIITESGTDLPFREGSSLLPPLPGLEKEKKVSKLFACPSLPDADVFGAPYACYSVDLEGEQLAAALDTEGWFPALDAALDDREDRPALLAAYREAYDRLFGMAFRENLSEQERLWVGDTVKIFERALEELLPFYRELMPEFFGWYYQLADDEE